jgi:hypothetical protein
VAAFLVVVAVGSLSAAAGATTPKTPPPKLRARSTTTTVTRPLPASAPFTPHAGYRLAGADGSIYAFGATNAGSLTGTQLNRPIVAVASTRRFGYWLAASDGGIFSFGDAAFYGSTGSIRLNRPVVGIAATPSGHGYWLVASDGGIFSFGDAAFYGSTGSMHLNRPIVGMTASPTGHGYWLVASDGGVFAFGDARFSGSTGSIRLNRPVVGMAATPTVHGYWLVASDGGIFSFGDARFFGSTGSIHLNRPIVGMAASPTGAGYWFVASDGGVFNYGDAHFWGSTGSRSLPAPIVGIAAQRVADPFQPGTTGYDISWPQCGGAYPSAPHAVTVVGVNDGDMYSKNPCLASEAAWAGESLTVYVNADGLPNDATSGLSGPAGHCAVSDIACRSYNYGANGAVYDVAYARSLGLSPLMWWLDVELDPTWRADVSSNVQVVRGLLAGLNAYGKLVGIYSNTYQWGVITGNTYNPATPIWVPTGDNRPALARSFCDSSHAFGGSEIWLTQWTVVYDQDYACPI